MEGGKERRKRKRLRGRFGDVRCMGRDAREFRFILCGSSHFFSQISQVILCGADWPANHFLTNGGQRGSVRGDSLEVSFDMC